MCAMRQRPKLISSYCDTKVYDMQHEFSHIVAAL